MFIPKLSRATQITILAVAILAGILIGRGGISLHWAWTAVFAIQALVLLRFKPRLGFLLLLAAALSLGVWRGGQTIFEKTQLGKMIDQKMVVTGVITDDPTRNEKGSLVFTIGSIRQEERHIHGKIRVYTNYQKLQRGYAVRVEGKVVKNLGSVRARFTFGQVEVLSDKIGSIDQFRQNMFASSRTAIPDSLAGFGLGLLIGVKGLIPEGLQETLTIVGLTHLIAVSGYNLTIIVQAVNRVFGSISTYLATAASVWLIVGFMLTTGFSASIVRAAFVAGLALLAQYYGHKIKAMTLIAIPAAVTAAFNPDYLMYDIGWQLSFLAFFGILVLAPAIEQKFFARPNLVTSLATQSLSAHIMTFPLILLIFNQMSVVAPLSNLLILPLVPLAMLLSFVIGAAGLISPILASWIALPTTGLLSLMVGMAQWMAGWQWASMKLSITPFMTVAFYISIGLLILAMKRGSQANQPVARSILKDKILT